MTVCGNEYDPSGQNGRQREILRFGSLCRRQMSIWRYSDTYQCSRRRCHSSRVTTTSWCIREVLDVHSSLRREFTVVMSFDWVRRGVLHRIVAGILLPSSEQQRFVIVGLESSGMKSSCNAASLMWFDRRDRFGRLIEP